LTNSVSLIRSPSLKTQIREGVAKRAVDARQGRAHVAALVQLSANRHSSRAPRVSAPSGGRTSSARHRGKRDQGRVESGVEMSSEQKAVEDIKALGIGRASEKPISERSKSLSLSSPSSNFKRSRSQSAFSGSLLRCRRLCLRRRRRESCCRAIQKRNRGRCPRTNPSPRGGHNGHRMVILVVGQRARMQRTIRTLVARAVQPLIVLNGRSKGNSRALATWAI